MRAVTLFRRGKSWGRYVIVYYMTATSICKRYKHGRKRKELFRARPIGQCGRRRRCLHGLCHGSQWPWLTSPVLSASPAVARARRAFNHLHLLVSSGSANNSHCFCRELLLLWPLPRISHVPIDWRTLLHVERAPNYSFHSYAAQGRRR